MKFIREVPGMMLAPLVVGAMALLLHLLSAMPGYLQSMTDNEYNSVEEAESAVGFEIVLPVYFPSYLSWPPALILAQTQPVPMSRLVFLSSDSHTETLVLYQVASSQDALPSPIPWIQAPSQTTSVTINGNEGELITGKRADGQTVHGVHWREKGWHFVVVTTQPERELLLIARSMHPRG